MDDKIIVYPDADEDGRDARDPLFSSLHDLGEFRVFRGRPSSNAEYIDRIREAHGIILGWDLPGEVMVEAKRLEIVCFTGIGAGRFVDLNLANTLGISVCNCPGYSDNTVAEHALALLMATARSVAQGDRDLRAGVWNQSVSGMELRGKTVGLVGFGGIGARFAEICHALGMTVLAWTRNVTPERAALSHVRFVDLDELYSSSDVVSLHLASTDDNAGFIGLDAFSRMKPGVLFINTARAELVDEKALLMVLQSGSIGGVGLDVFWEEPLPMDHELLSLDNVVVTPHVGFNTPEATEAIYRISIENMVSYFAGKPVNVVNSPYQQ